MFLIGTRYLVDKLYTQKQAQIQGALEYLYTVSRLESVIIISIY